MKRRITSLQRRRKKKWTGWRPKNDEAKIEFKNVVMRREKEKQEEELGTRSKTPEGRSATFRIQFLFEKMCFSFFPYSSAQNLFLALNCCTISRDISYNKHVFEPSRVYPLDACLFFFFFPFFKIQLIFPFF